FSRDWSSDVCSSDLRPQTPCRSSIRPTQGSHNVHYVKYRRWLTIGPPPGVGYRSTHSTGRLTAHPAPSSISGCCRQPFNRATQNQARSTFLFLIGFVFGFVLGLGRGKIMEFLFVHRLVHRFGRALQITDLLFAFLGS